MGRMDNFVLFYRALFGFTPEQLWEIPDTMGLIQSRTMESAGRTIRLPLIYRKAGRRPRAAF
jgi:4-hydroxyphenylpyruvate dioxygenase